MVVIIPNRPNPDNASFIAGGNLTVVRLPTNDAERITLKAGNFGVANAVPVGSLVVVSALDVGATGILTLSAGKTMTLGGKVEAGTLNVSAGDDLTLVTEVGLMNVELQGSGSDFLLRQTGAITISELKLQGGNITIEASGDVRIDQISGSVGDITIVATGSITIDSKVAPAARAGRVTLVSGSGAVDVVLSADTLDIKAVGSITVSEFDGLAIERLQSRSGGAVTVTAGGNLVIDAGIVATGSNAVSITSTGGSMILSQAITTDEGGITLRADPASGIGIELGALADLRSNKGDILLDAGRGRDGVHRRNLHRRRHRPPAAAGRRRDPARQAAQPEHRRPDRHRGRRRHRRHQGRRRRRHRHRGHRRAAGHHLQRRRRLGGRCDRDPGARARPGSTPPKARCSSRRSTT